MESFLSQIPEPILISIAIFLSVYQLFIKGFAIWKASRYKQRNWFVGLFILIPFNDLGILELIYLFRFAKKQLTIREIKSWFTKEV